MSLAKVQQWIATRRAAKRAKGKKGGGAGSGAASSTAIPEIREHLEAPAHIPRSSSVGSRPNTVSITTSPSSDTIHVQNLQDSPGERRRSSAFYSQQVSLASESTLTSGMTTRSRAFTHSGGDGDNTVKRVLLKLSPSFKKRNRSRSKSPSRSASDLRMKGDDGSSTTSEVWKAGEVRGGMAMLCGGGQLKLPDSILEGDMKKEGFLQKHGRRFGGWKRRWFVLDSSVAGEVSIYKSDLMTGFSGVLVLDQILGVQYPSTVASFGFTFEVITTRRTYVLAAKSEEEAIHWIHLLRRASHTDKPKELKHSHSRFFVKVDKEFKGPRTEEQLKEGLERSEGTKEERVKVLREHLEQLVKEETSAKEREEQPSEIVEAAEEKPTVDVAKEGLAIDALKAFLAAN